MILVKKFRFESAHRLSKGYQGKCANIHGHSWNGELRVQVAGLDDFDMGVDYGEMKKWLAFIDEEYDHALLLWEDDPVLGLGTLQERIVTFPRNPTSEHLAEVIFHRVAGQIEEFLKANPEYRKIGLQIHCVTIEETCTSRCEYYL